MPHTLVDVKFSQVPPNTRFTYEDNNTWVKSTWRESINSPHNAYRTDYGATPSAQVSTWWKLFDDNDVVQIPVLEV